MDREKDRDQSWSSPARRPYCGVRPRLLVRGPWTERKTEINRGRVQRVDRIAEFDAKRLIGIERSSDADQNLRQIGVHTPVTALVGICQSRTRNLAANAKVVEFAGNSTQA